MDQRQHYSLNQNNSQSPVDIDSPRANCGGSQSVCGDSDIITQIKILSSKKNIEFEILYNTYKENGIKSILQKEYCGRYATIKICDQGHRLAKRYFCQSEFCDICSQEKSPSHLRRVSRQLESVFSFDSLCYFVFTLPHCREVFDKFLSDKKVKRDIQREVIKILKNNLNIAKSDFKAIGRWHWFGDDKEFKDIGTKDEFHPHLNILLDKAYVKNEYLAKIKIDYTNFINEYFNVNYAIVDIFVHYEKWYDDNVLKSGCKYYHRIKYITRATHRYIDDLLSIKLYNLIDKSKNIFYINKKRFDKIKGRERLLTWLDICGQSLMKKDAEEWQRLNLEYKISLYYRKDVCHVCGHNYIDELTERRAISDLEIECDYNFSYVQLNSISPLEVKARLMEIKNKKWEKQRKEYKRDYLEVIAKSKRENEEKELKEKEAKRIKEWYRKNKKGLLLLYKFGFT